MAYWQFFRPAQRKTALKASIVGDGVNGDTSREYVGGVLASTYVVRGINSPWYQFNADGTGAMKDNIGLPDDTIHFTYHVTNDSLYLVHPDEVIATKITCLFPMAPPSNH